MRLLRSILYAAIFYPGTALFVLAGISASLFGTAPMRGVVHGWCDFNHWLARHLLRIRVAVQGQVPEGGYLIAVKHQSMFETTEMMRIARTPVVVLKRELSDIPLFGWLTRRYGVIVVDRDAGAKALRAMMREARAAKEAGRPVMIYPEGTRVRPGETPPLGAGFAGLYRALGLPVVPVAMDSGRLWGRGLVKQPGTIHFVVGDAIPAGLPRDEIERRVHSAINALESAA
ncbi:1-acyl-sn-glycerol-3-phosphate acyltransferase [Sphingomonas sinipercae]|uniref:1-acyl-sn-glycerol-3-phosphate acyltransferase n=1 Tax=Sphingomonas sinipercae TaxID=2714944 RepID=A0A6G7ZKT9_9SPHN|nr:lysophospholipid acyltransferase family protein [Sphingomonas sinipercae]QIL01535.1 1-acyl-sn-glycerol-3-phosphate acyltransferase [Sphingomonas sinipercae]